MQKGIKKIVFIVTCVAICSYGGGAASRITVQQKKPQPQKPAAAKGTEDGKQLLAKSDCNTCHREDFKLVGPAFRDIAKKYAASSNSVNYLATKIIKGGSGVWGEVPMAPHPNISITDAKKITKYILTIK